MPDEAYAIPFGEANVTREGDDATIVAFGRMVNFANEAADNLKKRGIACHRRRSAHHLAARHGDDSGDGGGDRPARRRRRGASALRHGGRHRRPRRRARLRRAERRRSSSSPRRMRRCRSRRRLRTSTSPPSRRSRRRSPRSSTTGPSRRRSEKVPMSEKEQGEAFSLGARGRRPEKSAAPIRPITMPKWGLAMEEGILARWAVEEGAEIAAGQEIMDIETTKIANVFESPVAGVLRKKVVKEGETVPVGALLGVVAEPGVADAEVEKFVGAFLENFKPAEAGESAPGAGDRRRRRPPYPAAEGRAGGRDGTAADPPDPRLRRRPHDLDVQPRRTRARPSGPRDRPSRPRRLGEGRRRRLGFGARRRRSRLHGRGRHPVGASRRPFARRCHCGRHRSLARPNARPR